MFRTYHVPLCALDRPIIWGHIGGMKRQKFKTQYPGVRYYEHPTRKMRNGQPDRFFSIRYMFKGQASEETLGWGTEGWNAEKAHDVLSKVKNGQRIGDGPGSVAEMRSQGEARRKATAEAARRDALAEMSLQTFLTDYYMPRAKKEKRSWLTDEQRIAKHITPALGNMPFRAVKQTDVQHLIDTLLEGGAAAATVKQYMGLIRRAYNIAAETIVEGKALFEGINPAKGIRLPAVHNARERFLSAQEAEDLIEAAKQLRCPDMHDAIVLSLNTGLRLGELRRLHWPDVDLTHGILTVREEDKRKPGGKVPLNTAASAIFSTRLKNRGESQLVFPPIYGQGQRENLSHDFRNLADTLKLNEGISGNDRQRRIVFHSLRHTFASWLAIAGTDIYRIKTLMRHKSITMTMRYAHLIPDATRDAVHNLMPPKKP